MANLLTAPTDIGNAAWLKSNGTIGGTAIPSPDGLQDGKVFIENTATSVQHVLSQNITVAASVLPYSIGCYAKGSGRSIWIEVDATGGAGVTVGFDLINGVQSSTATAFGAWTHPGTASMTNLGNGWYLLKLENFTNDNSSTTLSNTFLTSIVSGGTTLTYTGDGVSGIYLTELTLVQATTLGQLPFVPWIVKRPWIWSATRVRR